MNWVDLAIIGAFGLALTTGYRRGAIVQVFSWGGFLGGLVVGGLSTPPIVHWVDPPAPARAIASLVILFGIAFVLEGLISYSGSRLARRVRRTNFKQVDHVLGSAIAGLIALLSVWFLSVPAKRLPELSAAIKNSAILTSIPPAPNLLAQVGNFLGRGFPEVFAQLNPSLAPGVEPAPDSLKGDRQVLAAAELTYKIESDGCGGKVDGSGFPTGPNTVVTAAHVVAGTRGTRVIKADGANYPAVVVYMDTDTDIAVLSVSSLPGGRLPVANASAQRGTDGAAIGYPGGGKRTISVARVRARTDAVGYDIYSRDRVSRDIYVLRAHVRQGNSGGPFVDTDGRVRGMIFAAASDDAEESYALSEEEIDRALERGRGRTAPVRTGRCAI